MLRKGLSKDILILLASIADDLSAYTSRNQIRQLYFDGWYKRTSFGPAVSRLLIVGNIEKIIKNGETCYRLTSAGFDLLKESIPLYKLASRSWDKKWRIVIFDISEKNRLSRDILRDKLFSIGFGRWQESVYITPHSVEQEINQFLKEEQLFPQAVCLMAGRNDLGNDRKLAARVWRLNELNEEYDELIDDLKKVFLPAAGNGKNQKLHKLLRIYRDLILKDPMLPKELLPKGWLGERARQLIKKILR